MAKIHEIIEQVDETRPNNFTEKVKLRWLSELEGKIAADVMLMSIDEIREMEYKYPDCMDAEPLVSYPHQDIYVYWLEAKIDYANGEYNKYQNSMEMYNQHYSNFVRWFASTYEPANGYQKKACHAGWEDPPYYISAYGLAVKKGYTGSLDEWLESLNGKPGMSAYEYAKAAGFTGTEEEFAALLAEELKVTADVLMMANHIQDKENPHEVDPEQIGAAKAQHTHSVEDLNDGKDTLKKLMEKGYLILSEKQYGPTFPADAPDGTLFFIPLEAVSS